MTEAELRARVVHLAHAADWLVFSLPIAKTRRPVKDAAGYPDLTLARRGEVLWFELKVDGGKLTAKQEAWRVALWPRCHVITPASLQDGTLVRWLA